MPLLLRKLNHLLAWDLYNPDPHPWLRAGEFGAEPLSDLTTSNNTISVYSVEKDDNTNLLRIAAALVIARGKYDRFDYVLFPESVVFDLGFRLVSIPGNTADPEVNGIHRDISEISAQRLVELAGRIFREQQKFGEHWRARFDQFHCRGTPARSH